MRWLLLALAIGLAACSAKSPDSLVITTGCDTGDDLGKGTSCVVTLSRCEDHRHCSEEGTEKVTFTAAGSAEHAMVFDPTGGYYRGTDETVQASSVVVAISTSDGAVLRANVPMPPKLEVTAVHLSSDSSKPLRVSWANPLPGALVKVWLSRCGEHQTDIISGYVDDTGDGEWAGGAIYMPKESRSAGTCATVHLLRVLFGTVDPAFDPESGAYGYRHDSIDVKIEP